MGFSGDTVLREVYESHCQPASAHYVVSFQYMNGMRTFSYSMKNVTILQDSLVPGVGPDFRESVSRVWTEDEVQTLKSLNHYALLDTIVTPLAGSYDQMFQRKEAPEFSFRLDNGTTAVFTPLSNRFFYNTPEPYARNASSGANFEIGKQRLDDSIRNPTHHANTFAAPNKTWIRDTVLNRNRDSLMTSGPDLDITEAKLNELVANATIAAMLAYYPLSKWNTTVTAKITTYRNTYSFSRPLSLVLPYTLSLALTLPFLVVGYLSLRRNGVAALSDSFLQLVVTMTRSEELDRLARPCELGGEESMTKELKDTRVMFGELARQDGARRRLGFGLPEEIVPLLRRER